jgi:ParB family transcriptional regulator, chromosome partitioning protein
MVAANRQSIHRILMARLQRDDLNVIVETEALLELLAIEIEGTVENVTSALHRANHAKNRGQELEAKVAIQFQTIQKTLLALGRCSAESFRTSRLPLLNLPKDVLIVLREGNLEFTKARAISQVKDERQRCRILKATTSQNLSLSQIKNQIALVKGETDPEVEPSMVDRFSQAIKTINQTKRWNDPKKKRKFEKLVLELESFLGD